MDSKASRPVNWTAQEEATGGRLIDRLDGIVHPAERLFALIASVCIFALMLIGVVNIVGRQIFSYSIFGYVDMVELSISIFAFMAIAYCERLGGHVRMELLVGNLRGRWLWALEVIGTIVALFVVAVLVYYGWTHAMRAYHYGDSTIDAQYPWWPSKMLTAIAFMLLWLRLLINLVGYGRLFLNPQATPIAVPLIADVKRQAEEEAADAGVLEAASGNEGARP
ncbi:MAG: TRAP transporter small permease [Burkholderiaceae bacterium]|nr:TRAP transporter small permease [Burkholderiaceae bacterium]MEB2319552.1 TRAP transporter small permease [Pseudomonadota bacterium]